MFKLLMLALMLTTIFNQKLYAKSDADWRNGTWRIENQWNSRYENLYSEFIQKLGESRCNTTPKCIRHKANIYRQLNPKGMPTYSDCADLPLYLRAYFAYMNNLPFSWINEFTQIGGSRKDVRYSPYGNRPTKRRVVKDGENVKTILSQVTWISSAVFRMPPETKTNQNSGRLISDFYSPTINKDSIRPGTNVYDPNGHVAIIYKVESNGVIRMMDAHPDNTISRIVYGKKFIRSRSNAGAGFKNWRPYTYSSWGQISGVLGNNQIDDFGVEQFYGNTNVNKNKWSQGRFTHNGETLKYYDFIRSALSKGRLVYNPLEEFSARLDSLCVDIKDRAHAIENSFKKGIQNKAHIPRLPSNIYGTHGEWETYSTPSRDARLKTSFIEAVEDVIRFRDLLVRGSNKISFDGSLGELEGDLLAIYLEKSKQCQITYTKSNGQKKTLNLDDITKRLYDLSFSPYHCIELRWGAQGAQELLVTGQIKQGSELASCRDSSDKLQWYRAQRTLRNQVERNYDAKMDYTASQLLSGSVNIGVENPTEVDFVKLLSEIEGELEVLEPIEIIE